MDRAGGKNEWKEHVCGTSRGLEVESKGDSTLYKWGGQIHGIVFGYGAHGVRTCF